jgi:serine-type D-Ala-D-Ala carboxypeptidase/endopeptidase (penicillin-binding protein 4)
MRNTIRKIALVFLIFFLLIQAGNPTRIQTEIDQLNNDAALTHGEWGLYVMTADSGKEIASYNAQKSLMPASTMKILTTGAAMGLLGESFRYTTEIQYDGAYDSLKGIIRGNLIIKGSGDPTLQSAYFKTKGVPTEFEKIGEVLAAKGIKTIEGNIIGDASCFDQNPVPDGWQWGDLGQYYGATISGLAYKGNSITLFFNSTKTDSCIIEKMEPKPDDVVYRSFVKTGGKKDEAYVYGAPYGKEYWVTGTIPAGKTAYQVEASNPDPAYSCASDLKAQLITLGIKVNGKATTVRRLQNDNQQISIERKKLTEIKSPKLSEIIQHINTISDNVYAEQLLRTIGLLKGEGGTTEAGAKAVMAYWAEQGIAMDGFYMTDGSGLSRSNLVTTEIQAKVLQKIYLQTWFKSFDKSLPVSGKTGSMTNICKGTAAENNMRAKTGYINRARGYAGYVKTKSGKLLCFSLLANNYTCSATDMKKKLEKVLVALAELD